MKWQFVALLLLAIASRVASADDCTRRRAERATVPQIAAHPDRYLGSCVVIDGVMQGTSLFESVDGVYLQPPDGLNPASSGFRVGVTGVKDSTPGYRHVTLVGHVQDCERVRDRVHSMAGEDEIVMVSGYCHSFNGPYVEVHAVRHREGPPFRRQMGSYERKDYGDIEPAPADWPHRTQIEELAAAFLMALRHHDAEELANIHFRNVGLQWEDDEAEMLRLLLKDRKSPFASLRTSKTPPQQIILVDRSQLNAEERDRDSDNYTAVVCFCREPDCSHRWPIASFDADNLPSRPYACTHIHPYLDDGRWLTRYVTEQAEAGLSEP